MLKLGVQLHLTPALSKACHPHTSSKNSATEAALFIYTF